MEGFERHPPLILPSSSFQLELRSAPLDPALLLQLCRLQEFIGRLPRREGGAKRSLGEQVGSSAFRKCVDICYWLTLSAQTDRSSAPLRQAGPHPGPCPSPEVGRGSDLSGCEAVLTQKLKSLVLQNSLPGQADLVYHKSLALDPSCLLTPPNTPQGSELDSREEPHQNQGRT